MEKYTCKHIELILYQLSRIEAAKQFKELSALVFDLLHLIIPFDSGGFLEIRKKDENFFVEDAQWKGIQWRSYVEGAPVQIHDLLDLYDQTLFFRQNTPVVRTFRVPESPSVVRKIDFKDRYSDREFCGVSLIFNNCVNGFVLIGRDSDGHFSSDECNLLMALIPYLSKQISRLPEKQSGESNLSYGVFVERFDLSKREAQVACLLQQGKNMATICDELYIANSTLKKHIGNILHKTGAENCKQLTYILSEMAG